ncbi:MAG: hypothetical protein IJD97_05375 [Clostridia bacterium]|nr:hypothetical protein [Clostridia bacterium]
MKKKTAFLIILALIILYSAISYTAIPYKGIICLGIILGIAVVVAKALKKDKNKEE